MILQKKWKWLLICKARQVLTRRRERVPDNIISLIGNESVCQFERINYLRFTFSALRCMTQRAVSGHEADPPWSEKRLRNWAAFEKITRWRHISFRSLPMINSEINPSSAVWVDCSRQRRRRLAVQRLATTRQATCMITNCPLFTHQCRHLYSRRSSVSHQHDMPRIQTNACRTNSWHWRLIGK